MFVILGAASLLVRSQDWLISPLFPSPALWAVLAVAAGRYVTSGWWKAIGAGAGLLGLAAGGYYATAGSTGIEADAGRPLFAVVILGTGLLVGAAFAALGYATQRDRGTAFGRILVAALCGALFFAESAFMRRFTALWPLEAVMGLAVIYVMNRSAPWKTIAVSAPIACGLFFVAYAYLGIFPALH